MPLASAVKRAGFVGWYGTQRDAAVRSEPPVLQPENIDLGALVEIHQDVSAENHVERGEMGKILQQVELPVLHHGADAAVELPPLSGLREILDQHLNRQAA